MNDGSGRTIAPAALPTVEEIPDLGEMLGAVVAGANPASHRPGRGRQRGHPQGAFTLSALTIALIVAASVVLWRSSVTRHGGAGGQVPAQVAGIAWRLVSVAPRGGPLPPQATGIGALHIEAGRFTASDGCNAISGTAVLTRTTITFTTTNTTQAGCYASASVAAALNTTVRWVTTERQLILTLTNRHTLIYQTP